MFLLSTASCPSRIQPSNFDLKNSIILIYICFCIISHIVWGISSLVIKGQFNKILAGLGICSHCSFPLSDLSELLMVAHFLWAPWSIRSRSLIFLSDLSESLTVAHLIWAKWANERMSEWALSEWANSQPWSIPSVLPLFPLSLLFILSHLHLDLSIHSQLSPLFAVAGRELF